MHKEVDIIPNYPSLPSKLICKLLSLTLHVCVLPPFLLWLQCDSLPFVSPPVFLIGRTYLFAQADSETDEVYAQMTLQPVNKVS